MIDGFSSFSVFYLNHVWVPILWYQSFFLLQTINWFVKFFLGRGRGYITNYFGWKWVDDKLVCHYSSDAKYSMTSGYKKAISLRRLIIAIKLTDGKGIWYVQMLNKMKLFLWRACHHIVPCYSNLFRRDIVSLRVCLICNIEESIIHALWRCKVVKPIWKAFLCFLILSPRKGRNNFHDFFFCGVRIG